MADYEFNKNRDYISNFYSEYLEWLYVNMSEECAELAKACTKMARIIDPKKLLPVGEDVTFEKVRENLTEELSDVLLLANILGIKPDENIQKKKLDRWRKRIDPVYKKASLLISTANPNEPKWLKEAFKNMNDKNREEIFSFRYAEPILGPDGWKFPAVAKVKSKNVEKDGVTFTIKFN